MTYRPSSAMLAAALLIAAFLLLPSLMAVPASFSDRNYLSLPDGQLSLRHYARFWADAAWQRAFLLSVTTSFSAAILSTLLGTAFAIGIWDAGSRWSGILRTVVLLPLAIPGIVAALALYLLWTRLGLYDTRLGVVLVQMIVGLPFVVITVTAGLALFDRTLLRASRSLGAGSWTTLRRVVLPNLRAPVLSGFVLALVSGWDESVITLFVTGRSVQVLPRKIWDSLRYDIDPIVAVVATIMLSVTVIGVLLFLALSKRPGSTVGGLR